MAGSQGGGGLSILYRALLWVRGWWVTSHLTKGVPVCRSFPRTHNPWRCPQEVCGGRSVYGTLGGATP